MMWTKKKQWFNTEKVKRQHVIYIDHIVTNSPASPLPVTVEKRRKMAEFIQRFPQ